MSTHSRRLRAKLALLQPQMQASAARLWNHPELRSLFPEYLCTVHASIRATVPLLRLASESARAMAETDPVAAQLVEYYAEHAEEEVDHDDWLLDDLESLGLSRQDVLARMPSPNVAALVGSQYYWIENHHPIAFMGYLAVLERPSDPGYYRRVVERTGLPPESMRTLLHHAELDTEHLEELDNQLDNLPLTAFHENVLGVSALATAGTMALVLEEVVNDYERRR